MRPLAITAELRSAIALPGGPLHLDGLLAWAVAQVQGLPPLLPGDPIAPVEIPVAREPGGRFHLCSSSVFTVEHREHRWVNRRFPIEEAQIRGDARLRRIHITTGPGKSYRIPLETLRVEGDRLRWWCIGDELEIRALLPLVVGLGKKRGVGAGAVERWTVEPCDPWGDGFPIVRDGRPLRPLPIDWPGLVDPDVEFAALSYPYWHPITPRVECAVPGVE